MFVNSSIYWLLRRVLGELLMVWLLRGLGVIDSGQALSLVISLLGLNIGGYSIWYVRNFHQSSHQKLMLNYFFCAYSKLIINYQNVGLIYDVLRLILTCGF